MLLHGIRLLPIIFLLFFKNTIPQTFDTLKTETTFPDSLLQTTNDTQRVDSTVVDTIGLFSISDSISYADTLIPIHQDPLYSNSYFISHKEMMKLDYRYAADFLKPFPFTFIRDQGFIGQPNEVTLYGFGFSGISYLQDGLLVNDRFTNSLDLNYIQSEYIDSIEIIPSPRGFLYGIHNNPAVVNFITKDFISIAPYSRIKYYEGPFGEAMIDGIFNTIILKDLNFSVDITNRKFDSSYTNSEFSIWQAKVRLKYFLSDNINFMGTYSFVDSKVGLNGGVDIDSIAATNDDINSILYNEQLAPVNFVSRMRDVTQHHFDLKLLCYPFKNAKTDFNLYYKFYLDDVNNDGFLLKQRSKDKIYGASLFQKYADGIFNIDVYASYEKARLNYYEIEKLDSVNITEQDFNNRFDNYALSASASLMLVDSTFIPSIFFKRSYYEPYSLGAINGFGFDLVYKPFMNSKIYLGFSRVEFSNKIEAALSFETGFTINFDDILLNFIAFNRFDPYPIITGPEYLQVTGRDHWGLGGKINFKVWKVALESNASYNFFDEEDKIYSLVSFMKFRFASGIFFKDTLFNSNLDLKTGFLFNYFGQQKLSSTGASDQTVPSSYRIDFTLAGEIQNRAIVYFTWENLLDEEYYIVPYYPMPERHIRFGVAWEILN